MSQDEETHQRGFSRKRFAMTSCSFCPAPSFNFLVELFPRSLGVNFAVLGIPFGYGFIERKTSNCFSFGEAPRNLKKKIIPY